MIVEDLKAQWSYNKHLHQVLRESYEIEQNPEVKAKLLKHEDESEALDNQYWQALINHIQEMDAIANDPNLRGLERYEKLTKLSDEFKPFVEQYELKSTQLHEELIRIKQSK
nr:MAG TPA: hypothetical protein [Bacteriophage sp.]